MPLSTRDGRALAGLPGLPLGVWGAMASGQSNLQLTNPILWVMIGISTAGALVTFAFLVYSIWRFRDPAVRRRRYG
ncbi:MAG TPA: hypothetical protein VML94_04295 [Thermoplasmata archaeon]|nr:hypothetical protein [Thermoplasmata archaeon]